MMSIIPKPDYRPGKIVFISHGTQARRQEMNLRPYPTPTTAAPFLNPGITATQSALAIFFRPEAVP
jgi:hypothetical protein